MDLRALIADLDGEQRRAVTTESRLVAVVAGAGSGKTRVLTRRIAYRVLDGSADAAHTLVLTFTREAAGELRRRLPGLGLTGRVHAGTFHSVAQRLLRQRWIDRDEPQREVIGDPRRLLRRLAGDADLDAVAAEVAWAGARGLGPDDYAAAVRRGDRRPPNDRVPDILSGYIAEKRRRREIDLDDLLALTNRHLADDADWADVVRWQYRHVLVDEAQDLNPLQHRFVDLIRAGRDDLFLVGDPAQAIYAFTGSDPTLLVDVETRFPGIEVIRLPVNRRSTPQVVDAGAHVLHRAAQEPDVRSARDDGAPVAIHEHADEDGEATWIAEYVAQLDPGLLRRPDGVAVLARTHAVLAPIGRALDAAGVPRRGPGSASTAVAGLLRTGGGLASANDLRRWAHDLADEVGDDDPRAAVAAVALDFLREQPTGGGAAFRDWVRATDPFGGDEPGVDVLTFHAAKGREWHTVVLAGFETGLVPHRSATTVAARGEEARLAYVAVTRATDVAIVNWARRRNGYQRQPTPLLSGFESAAPASVAPPRELVELPRDPQHVALDRLREWRAAAARAGGMVPDAVCTDRALAVIAERRPASPEELDAMTGLGPLTARRLFDGIAAALADA